MKYYSYFCTVTIKNQKTMNGYSIYLMIQLAQELNLIEKELEYDLAWEQGTGLHQEFVGGEFDDSNKPEYECILEFLKSKGGSNPKTITTCSNCGSRDVEIRSWIHQRTGVISGETGEDDDTYCNSCDGHHGVETETIE